ncbi:zinc-dependent alcohol dehydrogenase family protein [Janthinobacterium agaricidamnosum]|uniref:Zinc-binding dehydrogenase family protein n=1 Tax=Janthinobacterium agaricidamnosum NBRC 102515 = DSM 9628 TaxID=1349767 RepID=W0V9K5_9BURK|nr:NAD(P)-dependent alcohol dehydrogenase [Janthinobacterium agaricidamnosum]CDG84300.1 zinc-binding dehydrogenase family protein [Janthinobacterium agaricidamnosum NBRC 102515 = DSM 9628]
MKKYLITNADQQLNSFQCVEADLPTPGFGEVLLKFHAASLNFLDLIVARGDFNFEGMVFPLVPGTDGAGVVAAIGPGVQGFSVGDAVIPNFHAGWVAGLPTLAELKPMRGVNLPGSLTEYGVVPAACLVPMPAHLSFEEAAALPIAAVTAWNAIAAGNVKPGSTVVLLGTGGVSLFALQFAKSQGARVIITSSSDDKLRRARELGADDTINYRTHPNWDEEVMRLTQHRGADLVVETIGQETFARSLKAAAIGATIFVIGVVSGADFQISIWPIMHKVLRIIGNDTGSIKDFRDAMRAIEAARITPVIDQVFAFEDAPAAYQKLAKGGHFGKIVISMNKSSSL